MKKLLILLFLLLASPAFGQSVVDTAPWQITGNSNLYVIKYTCTTAADGSLPVQTGATQVNGIVTRIVITPGVPAPVGTVLVTLSDFFGANIAGGVISGTTVDISPQREDVDGNVCPGLVTMHGGLRVLATGNSAPNAVFYVRLYVLRD